MAQAVQSIFDPALLADPYPAYHRLRRLDPVHWDDHVGTWVVTRYDDVAAALRDARLSSDRVAFLSEYKRMPAAESGAVFAVLANQLLFADPPRHTRLRHLVSKAFTPRAVEAMRQHIREVVDRLLDRVASLGRCELIRDLADPLPTTVIAEMLGVPPADRADFKRWSDDIAALLGNPDSTPDEARRIAASFSQGIAYFERAVERRRRAPADDLLSALIAAEEQGDRLSREELLANALLLLAAGNETTTNLIGNGVWALLRNPGQLDLLRADPTRTENAIEELLRYDSPVQFTARVATAELELGGRTIAPGQPVTLVIGAANRDPAHFSDPDRLDLTRPDRRHLSFGGGAHFCLGAPLARLEGREALAAIVRRLPRLRLADEPPRYRPNFGLRGLEALELAFEPAAA